MSSGEIVRLDLRLRRRMLIGTALGAAVYLLVVVAVYPSFRHDSAFTSVIKSNPAAAAAFGISGSITSPEGWLGANMYANFGPLLTLMLTIGYGAACIAGQNEEGLLGLVATQPIGRVRLVAQKLTALLLCSLVAPTVSLAVCLSGPHFQLHPGWTHLVEVTGALALLGFELGALALSLGVLTGRRGLALGVASAVAAASYLVSSMAPVVSAVHRVRWLSPFYWAVGDGQLVVGVVGWQWALLAGLGLVCAVGALVAVRRLDIT